APFALERLHLGLGALERRTQRRYQLCDRELALLERSLGDHLVPAERLTGEAQKELAVGTQRLPCERIECGTQPRFRLLEEAQTVGLLQDTRREPRLRRSELHAQRFDAPGGAQLRKERAEQQPREGSREPAQNDEGG